MTLIKIEIIDMLYEHLGIPLNLLPNMSSR